MATATSLQKQRDLEVSALKRGMSGYVASGQADASRGAEQSSDKEELKEKTLARMNSAR